MSTLYLVTPFQAPSTFHFPGEAFDSVNDAAFLAQAIAEGAIFASSNNGAVAAAAALCQSLHLRQGAPVSAMTNLMLGAMADQGSSMPKGANIAAGATAKPDLTSGKRFVLPAATLAANQALTLAPPGDAANVAGLYPIFAGTRREFTRIDAGAFTWAFVNGGPAAGTLATLIASKPGFFVAEFNGSDWEMVAASAQ